MKYVVILRHGHDVSGTLSEEGRHEIELLAARLSAIKRDMSVTVLTSLADRAIESAQIIADEFNTEVTSTFVLGGENGQRSGQITDYIASLLEEYKNTDILILVTHLAGVISLPGYIFSNILHQPQDNIELPQQGEAMIIDMEKVRYEID